MSGWLGPLHALVVLLDDGGGHRQALVALDLDVASRRVVERIAVLAAPIGIGIENLFVFAAHTHAGPDDGCADAVATATARALHALAAELPSAVPGRLTFAECPDPTVRLLVWEAPGAPDVVLAFHDTPSTPLPAAAGIASADSFGTAARLAESALGGTARARIALIGAAHADHVDPGAPPSGWAALTAHVCASAAAVTRLSAALVEGVRRAKGAEGTALLPYPASLHFREAALDGHAAAPLRALRFAGAAGRPGLVVAALPFELTPDAGRALEASLSRSAADGGHVLIVGFAGGARGPLTTGDTPRVGELLDALLHDAVRVPSLPGAVGTPTRSDPMRALRLSLGTVLPGRAGEPLMDLSEPRVSIVEGQPWIQLSGVWSSANLATALPRGPDPWMRVLVRDGEGDAPRPATLSDGTPADDRCAFVLLRREVPTDRAGEAFIRWRWALTAPLPPGWSGRQVSFEVLVPPRPGVSALPAPPPPWRGIP